MTAVPLAYAQRAQPAVTKAKLVLHPTRTHVDDLEISGAIDNVSAGETRFITYADLQQLPQVRFRLAHGTNFKGPVDVAGVRLEELARAAGAKPASMVVAICTDRYNAHYPMTYLRVHQPVLVLRINGLDHTRWSAAAQDEGMGPYLIAQDAFRPTFKVLSHEEEEQVPWQVVRLDFRREADVYGPIEPIGPDASASIVRQGYVIARENCFRCHARHGEGGTKAGVPWSVVASLAASNPQQFATYVRDPKKMNPASQMAASPNYDDATIDALRAYFQPFAAIP